jgi:hypothetical protein
MAVEILQFIAVIAACILVAELVVRYLIDE